MPDGTSTPTDVAADAAAQDNARPGSSEGKKSKKGPEKRKDKTKGPDKGKPGDLPTGAAEAGPSDPTINEPGAGESEANPRTPERRTAEAAIVVKSILTSEHRKRLVDAKGEIKKPGNPEEQALAIAHALLTGENDGDEPFTRQFPKATGDGHDIWMPIVNRPDLSGDLQEFGNDEIRLAGVKGVTPDGELICYFEDKDGNEVKNKDGSSTLQIPYTREEVLGLQMQSEIDTYGGIFTTDASQEVFQASLGKRDMDESLDPAIEAAAKSNRQMTTNHLKESATFKNLSADKQAELSQALDGVTVLTLTEWKAVAPILGLDRNSMKTRADELSAEIGQEAVKLKNNPEDKFAQGRIAELQTELDLIAQADQALMPRTEDGKSSTDDVFEQLQNGEINAEQAENVLNGLTSGDTNAIIESIAKSPDLTEGQKAWIKEHGGTIGKGVLWAILIGIATIPAIAAGAAYVGTQTAAGRK